MILNDLEKKIAQFRCFCHQSSSICA